jgi:hypothetical protein
MIPAPNRGTLNAERPFPGPYAYREEDAQGGYFQGRAKETKELTRLIRRNPLTLLFGASGLGKSSLLSAGLFPELRRVGHLPVRVKLKYDIGAERPGRIDLSQQIMADVRQTAQRAGVEVENGEDRDTLWEFFQSVELWGPEPSLLVPVIVLDQFEEAFTLGGQSRAARNAVTQLFEALGDLVENRMPRSVAMGRGPGKLTLASAERPPLIKVVLSMREEYLPNLEALRSEMPSIAHGRMRLRAFNGQEAADAILASAHHLLSPPVAGAIVRAVAGARAQLLRLPVGSLFPLGLGRWGEPLLALVRPEPSLRDPAKVSERELAELVIEPSLLNLFCYQLNEQRLHGATQPNDSKIDAPLVVAASANILSNFYAGCMRGLGRKARHFVENRLLSPAGFRLPIPEGEAIDSKGLSAGAVATLVDRRLIRRETRQDTTYLLLVHDVLARPIIEARTRRRVRRRYFVVFAVTALAVSIFFLSSKALELIPQVKAALRNVEQAEQELSELRTAQERQLEHAERRLARAASEREQALRAAQDAYAEMVRAQQKQRQAASEAERFKRAASQELERQRLLVRDAEERRAKLGQQAAELEHRHRELMRLNDQLERRQGIPDTLVN